MNNTQTLFLELFARAIQGDGTGQWPEMEEPDWVCLANLAANHHVLPMIYHQINVNFPFHLPKELHREWRCRTVGQVLDQERRSQAFLKVYQLLMDKGLTPVVVKGIVLRNLYPQPNQRPSSDEDLWIEAEDFQRYECELFRLGFQQVAGRAGSHRSYHHTASGLHLELHGQPFAQEGPCYVFNEMFGQPETQWISVDEVKVCTLEPTQHLVYLLCHAYQHFISCGVGIRQIGDVAVFAQRQHHNIDWDRVDRWMRRINLQGFWQTVCRIIHAQFHLLPQECLCFCSGEISLEPLLEDILEGGVYGKSSVARTASGQWTSVAASPGEKGASLNLMRVLFPPFNLMKQRYTWLSRCPVLLPIAWGMRWAGVACRLVRHGENPMNTWKIAKRRENLAHMYRIIERTGETS